MAVSTALAIGVMGYPVIKAFDAWFFNSTIDRALRVQFNPTQVALEDDIATKTIMVNRIRAEMIATEIALMPTQTPYIETIRPNINPNP